MKYSIPTTDVKSDNQTIDNKGNVYNERKSKTKRELLFTPRNYTAYVGFDTRDFLSELVAQEDAGVPTTFSRREVCLDDLGVVCTVVAPSGVQPKLQREQPYCFYFDTEDTTKFNGALVLDTDNDWGHYRFIPYGDPSSNISEGLIAGAARFMQDYPKKVADAVRSARAAKPKTKPKSKAKG